MDGQTACGLEPRRLSSATEGRKLFPAWNPRGKTGGQTMTTYKVKLVERLLREILPEWERVQSCVSEEAIQQSAADGKLEIGLSGEQFTCRLDSLIATLHLVYLVHVLEDEGLAELVCMAAKGEWLTDQAQRYLGARAMREVGVAPHERN